MRITGIIHAHSTYSYDAKLSLRELRALCIKNGLQFICMTEHTDELTPTHAEDFVRECAELSDATFRFIPGFEVPYRHAHILMIGMREFFGNYAPNIETLKTWTEKASFVVLAHPVRNDFEVEPELLNHLDALEVWNQQYEGKRVPRVRSLALFEKLKNEKKDLVATGGVDFHRTEHFGAPLLTLDIPELTESEILTALTRGNFTVSSEYVTFQGVLTNSADLARKIRVQSHLSVGIIILGKWVNATLARLGLKLPKSLKQLIRRRL